MNELTLIIPAKNEAESLPIVLNELKKYNYKINIVLHITDIDTIQVIKKYDVNIIYQKNLGYGDALIRGIEQCKTKYFCIYHILLPDSYIDSWLWFIFSKIVKN